MMALESGLALVPIRPELLPESGTQPLCFLLLLSTHQVTIAPGTALFHTL